MRSSHHSREAQTGSWEKFAQDDPYTYILTSLKSSDPAEFWQSGHRTVEQELLPPIETRRITRGTAMEIGCGVGRLLFPLSSHFREVVGADIAESMIQRARRFADDNGVGNVNLYTIAGPEDLLHRTGNYSGRIDFLYSLLVFQHIPDAAMIDGYLHVVGILLAEDGIAYLQFDTRPESVAYHIKTRMPDFLLPRFWRKGIRRIRRHPEEIERGIRNAGLEIAAELTPFTSYHRYILRKAGRHSVPQ
jgi:cyclopropane fatty-acyl-phospholipid synthase-like methyltransferase